MGGLLTPIPGLETEVKRGDKSFGYFIAAFGFLVTLFVGVISILPIDLLFKILLMIGGFIFLFYLCFFNNWLRNKIVGILSKSQEKSERHN